MPRFAALFIICAILLAWVNPAEAQSIVKICQSTTSTNCIPVNASNPLNVTGSFSATVTTSATATAAAPSYTEGQIAPISQDLSGNLRTLASVTLTLPTIGAAVPATGVYNGINVAGTLRGWSGLSTGSIFPGAVAIVDASGNQITSFGSTNTSVSATGSAVPANATYVGINSSGNLTGWNGAVSQSGTWNITNISGTITLPTSASTSTKQSDGSQKTQIVDGSGNVIASTSNNLNVQCANCSGSGASGTDEGAFTAGSSTFAPIGGFFQTTATSNALTNGQWGTLQLTATRAGFVNLRNAAGTEIGTSTTPVQVSLANTGANTNKLLVTPDSVALPANQSVNLSQVNAVTVLTGTGAVGTGAQRIAVGTDSATIAGSAPGTAGTASTNVVTIQGIASMTKLLVTPDANSAVNVAQINAVTPLMGNGVTGTGSQRVTIASDNTAFSVNATLQASSAVIGHVITDTTSTTAVTQATASNLNATVVGTGTFATQVASATAPVSTMNSASANAGVNSALAGVFDDVGPTAITENSFGFLRMSTNRNLYGTIRDAAGNERGANVNANNALLTAIDQTTVGTTNAVSIGQLGSTTVLTGNGASGAGALRVSIANDSTGIIQTVPGTSGGLTFFTVNAAASDNHANIKNGAGQVYSISAFNINAGASANYVRLYNAATGFNGCGSATNLQWSGIVPGATTGAGFTHNFPEGLTFATGISICISGAFGNTDTTNAVLNTSVNLGYK